ESSPMLAVMRRREQAIHDLRKSVGRIVIEKSLHLLLRRRQADEIERRAANERALVGDWIGLHLVLLQLGEDEVIDGRLNPIRLSDVGHGRFLYGFEGPVIAGVFLD